MAYVNVMEWKAEQVSEWLRGLDDVVYPYAHFFLNNDVTGQGLLNMTVDDLYKLHVEKLGHQEIILESLELLKNFHFNLDQENLQYICLKLSCKARSLYNEIQMRYPETVGKQTVPGLVMSAVGDVLESVRVLLSWLERTPFQFSPQFLKVRTNLISISLELATNAHREAFAEQPIDVIRSCCDKLGELADCCIREVTDPLLLQPASLDVATVRKKTEEELGVVVDGTLPGVHLVAEVNMLNPSTRIQPGDEIVQVNYQTVVGWQTKKVLQLMGENPGEVILTLKKRPKHSNLLGQVYMKPFRIPARKKSSFYINNLPSPRTELLVVPDVSIPIKKKPPSSTSSDEHLTEAEDSDSENDEAFLPVAASVVVGQIERNKINVSPTASLRSVLSRPRSAPQRRATISGSLPRSPTRPYINVSEMWGESHDMSFSTISSRDSGMSTMSAKEEFRSQPNPPTQQHAGQPSMRSQVTSAPNLRSRAFCNDKLVGKSAANVEFKNGSLNIKLGQPTHLKVSDKIVLKVEHSSSKDCSPRKDEPVKNCESWDSTISSRASVYMNVPGHNNGTSIKEDNTEGKHVQYVQGEPVHQHEQGEPVQLRQYVNVDTDLVNRSKNPLPKSRTSKPSLTSGRGGGEEPPPSASPGRIPTPGRGKRPVPLPRRLSAVDPGARPQGEHASASPATTPPATKGRYPGSTPSPRHSSQPVSGNPGQKITPTTSYKSYRRAAPNIPSVSPVQKENNAVGNRRRHSAVESDGPGHEYYTISERTGSPVCGGDRVGWNGAQPSPPVWNGGSKPIPSRLSFERPEHYSRLSSASSCDSGHPSSLSPTTPTPDPALPYPKTGQPALPPRNLMSSSKNLKL